MNGILSRALRRPISILLTVYSIARGSGALAAIGRSDGRKSRCADGGAPTDGSRGYPHRGIRLVNRLVPVRSDRRSWGASVLGAALALAGCTSPDEIFDPDFGSSVRHMIAMQTANPNQAAPGLDGKKEEAALREYRKDVARPKSVETKVIQLSF